MDINIFNKQNSQNCSQVRCTSGIFAISKQSERVYFLSLRMDYHEEVVRFDVAVQEGLAVYILEAREHLLAHHEHSLERETTVTVIEKILERGTQQLLYHDV